MLTDTQRLERKKGIGGSDCAAVCGMSKWKTPMDIFLDKTSEELLPEEDNRFMYWGNRLENLIREEYSIKNGTIINPNTIKQHDVHKFMVANIDGILPDGTILECKTASNPKEWGEPGSDEIPDEYLMQCAHYAIVYDAPKVDIAVLIGGNDFRIYTYQRNKDMEELIIEHESDFWNNNVLKNIPPEPIRGDDFEKAIKATKGDLKLANNSIKGLIEMLKAFNEQIKSIEAQKESLLFSIKEVIGDHDGLMDDAGNILATWKFQKGSRLDINALKKASPEIYGQYLKTTESRVFRLKEI